MVLSWTMIRRRKCDGVSVVCSCEIRVLKLMCTEIAFTARMVSPKPALNNDFAFQKVFGDGEFIAAGQLIIPVGGKKPSKGTKDNTYVR